MKKKTKKLVLAKETVRSLRERQDNLRDAAGGQKPPATEFGDQCYTNLCRTGI
jgi:hypothetical protein